MSLVEALMVIAVNPEEPGGADYRRRLGAGRYVNLVGRGLSVLAIVAVAGQVLDQPAAEGDVQQLHPAAEGQYRHIRRQGIIQRAKFQFVQRGVQFQPGVGVRFLAVTHRVNVRAAG